MYLGLYRLQVVGVSAGSRLWRPRNKRLQRISQPSRFGFPHLGFAPGLQRPAQGQSVEICACGAAEDRPLPAGASAPAFRPISVVWACTFLLKACWIHQEHLPRELCEVFQGGPGSKRQRFIQHRRTCITACEKASDGTAPRFCQQCHCKAQSICRHPISAATVPATTTTCAAATLLLLAQQYSRQ